MGNVVSNAKSKNIEIKTPKEPPKKPEGEEEASKYEPSEALISLWENIEPGLLNEYISINISKPYTLKYFDDSEEFEGYDDYDLIKGCKAFYVLTIWDGTDGHINFYELVDGENAGKIAATSYGNLKAYVSKKTMKELIEIAESLTWEDEEEDMMKLFIEVFEKF